MFLFIDNVFTFLNSILSATAAIGLFLGFKFLIFTADLLEIIFPFHLLGLKGLIGEIDNFLEFPNNPGYYYKIIVKHTDQTFTETYDNTTTDFKLITIEIRHGLNDNTTQIISDTFVISNII